MLVIPPALYAQAEAQDTPAVLEEVVVLGTLIPRQDYVSTSPVLTIGRDELDLGKRQSIAEILNQYPQFVPDRTLNAAGSTPPRAGAASVNLRGLGGGRNLVLINSRRLGPSGADAAVDINQLPVGLVESVEILTGGASSTYGADAVSGVVNFNLRSDVEGMELNAGGGRSDRGDGESGNISLLGGTGFAQGRGNVSAFLGFLDQDNVTRADRPYARVPMADDWRTGELYETGSFNLPSGRSELPAVLDGELAEAGLTFDEQGRPRPFNPSEDFYNFNRLEDLRYSQELTSFGALLHYDLDEDTRVQLDWIASDGTTVHHMAPATLLMNQLVVNLDNPLLHPQTRQLLASNYDAAGTGFVTLPFAYRSAQVGNRQRTFDRDTHWINLELTRSWSEDWRWTAAYTHSDARMKLFQAGGAYESRIQQAVLVDPASGECFNPENGCAPADIFGPARLSGEAVAFIRSDPYITREDTEQQIVSLSARGRVRAGRDYQLPLAMGLEWREDTTDYRPDPALLETAAFLNEYPIRGSDHVAEAYGELLLPLVAGARWAELLELEFGARYSDYSKIGDEWTWKFGMNWAPSSAIRFRGSYQRAARAPNMQESYRALVESTFALEGSRFRDPCAASNRPQDIPGYTELCLAQGIAPENLATFEPSPVFLVTSRSSGNTDLQVEMADTYTLGAVWTPESVSGLSLTLDYYRMELSDQIIYLRDGDAFELCFATGNDRDLCNGIQRTPGGDLSQVRGTFHNLEGVTTAGYDLALRYHLPLEVPWDWASSLDLSLLASRLVTFEASVASGVKYECAGKYDFPCHGGVRSKLRTLTNAVYRSGPLTLGLSWQWLDGADSVYGEYLGNLGLPYIEPESGLGDQSYLDLNMEWQLREKLSASFGIRNLTDTMPPLIPNGSTNTDTSVYDPLGRRYHVGIRLGF